MLQFDDPSLTGVQVSLKVLILQEVFKAADICFQIVEIMVLDEHGKDDVAFLPRALEAVGVDDERLLIFVPGRFRCLGE